MEYPVTRAEDVWDELAGVRTPDPYRWLQDDTEEVRLWQKQQAELASEHVRTWPGFERLRLLVEEHTTERFGSVPCPAGGHWFRAAQATDSHRTQVLVADSPYGEGRTAFESPEDSAYVSWFVPSPDGRLLAIGLCGDGSEQNTITLIDVTSGGLLTAPSERLMDSWSGGVAWLPDSTGFFVTVIDGVAIDLAQRVVFHDVRTGLTSDVEVPWTTPRDYRMVQVSLDGRRLVAYERLMNPVPVAVADLDDPTAPVWRPFITDSEALAAGYLVGDQYIAITDADAPRGRVVAVHVDSPGDWRTVVPESEAVLRGLVPVGDLFYVCELVDTYARVRAIDLAGRVVQQVPLPGNGAISEQPFPYMNLARPVGHSTFLFSFSTLISSWGAYEHAPGEPQVRQLDAPKVTVDAVVEDYWVTSTDGARVPYHVVRRGEAGPGPTLLYGYGGFNAAWVPQFPSAMAAFVTAGGTFVHAHLRGGGELGRDWWEQGRLKHKQNCYSDLYAIAEDLDRRGIATPDTLAGVPQLMSTRVA